MNHSIHKNFVRLLAAAISMKLILDFGIAGVLENAGLSEWAVTGLPWVPVALMGVIAVMIVISASSDGKVSGSNRLMVYVIGWSLLAVVFLLLQYAGDWIESALTWKLEWQPDEAVIDPATGEPVVLGFFARIGNFLSWSSVAFPNYISEFLVAFVGIFIAFGVAYGLYAAALSAVIALAIAGVGWAFSGNDKPSLIESLFVGNIVAKIAAVPMVLTALGIFVGATLWTVVYSFTKSGLLPKFNTFELYQNAGWFNDKSPTGRNVHGVFMQYERLWGEPRWIQSISNLAIYGACSLIFTLVVGFLLAAMLDRKIRFENTFRTIFLYPFALSFIVTGLVWQWILNPEFGLQAIVRDWGWTSFTFDPLNNQDIVVYGLLIAGLWQGTGLIMCIMLAGLRGIDEDIWKATKVDGIPTWKTYTHVIIPMLKPIFVTALVLITSGIVKLYDLVVAQTSGGPGISSEVPAKYVYDKMFQGQNLGQGFAASTMMLLMVVIILIPWAYLQFGGKKDG